VYRRRRPERTVLYEVVQQDLESWLHRHREAHPDDDPIPWYGERDFRRYLDCGILSRGFARARCGACGYDYLIAFSCSGRGVCPSCATRHMAEAHLVDHVFPQVPVAAPALAALMHPCMSRQWVLSLPKRLRYFVHRDSELAGPGLTSLISRPTPNRPSSRVTSLARTALKTHLNCLSFGQSNLK
jgi:hypothetical protein